jgi:hairy-and-enhancer-of-split protein
MKSTGHHHPYLPYSQPKLVSKDYLSNFINNPVKREPVTTHFDINLNKPGFKCKSEPVESRTEQYRKYMKPLLERKRRARINKCLDELKDLMMTVIEDQTSHGLNNKLEKADILEVTVDYLKTLKQSNNLLLPDEESGAKLFKIGYKACGEEVAHFLSGVPVDRQSADNLVQKVTQTNEKSGNGRLYDSQSINTDIKPKFDINPTQNAPNFTVKKEQKFYTSESKLNHSVALDLTLTNESDSKKNSWRPW